MADSTPILSISLDPKQVQMLRARLSPQQLKQATYQAVVRTVGTLKSRASKLLTDETNFVRGARPDSKTEMLSVKTDRGDIPVAWLKISGKPLPFSAMMPKVSKRFGVTVQPLKDKPAIQFRHAFRTQLDSGHVGIFLRARLPIAGPETTASDLERLGFEKGEARNLTSFPLAMRTDTQFLEAAMSGLRPELHGRGIRHMKRIAIGGNFPHVTPQGFAWRYPINELKGTSAAAVIGTAERLRPFLADGADILSKNVISQYNRFTNPRPN